jgi:hypothetical protein
LPFGDVRFHEIVQSLVEWRTNLYGRLGAMIPRQWGALQRFALHPMTSASLDGMIISANENMSLGGEGLEKDGPSAATDNVLLHCIYDTTFLKLS